jgi:hypothetical protein
VIGSGQHDQRHSGKKVQSLSSAFIALWTPPSIVAAVVERRRRNCGDEYVHGRKGSRRRRGRPHQHGAGKATQPKHVKGRRAIGRRECWGRAKRSCAERLCGRTHEDRHGLDQVRRPARFYADRCRPSAWLSLCHVCRSDRAADPRIRRRASVGTLSDARRGPPENDCGCLSAGRGRLNGPTDAPPRDPAVPYSAISGFG